MDDVFCFKQKTAYEMRISDWSSDVCSSDLATAIAEIMPAGLDRIFFTNSGSESVDTALKIALAYHRARGEGQRTRLIGRERGYHGVGFGSEEHTSELQSLMRISYAVFCLKKKIKYSQDIYII